MKHTAAILCERSSVRECETGLRVNHFVIEFFKCIVYTEIEVLAPILVYNLSHRNSSPIEWRFSSVFILEMVDVNIFLALLTVASVAVYFYIKRLYSYWDRIGVKSFAPTFPFGNLAKNVRQKLSIGELIAEFYRNTSERFVGIYSCLRPNLILCDPELIRNVCGRDFKYFYHRGFNVDEKIDPMTANVLFANGEKWKILREKLSPAFTSGKVKSMFDTIKDSGKSLHKYMDRHADTNAAVDIRDIFARFATNIIASVAFGIDIDCIVNPNEDFRRRGAQIFELNLKNTLRQFLAMTSPFLSRLFKVRFIDKSVEDFMTAIVQQNIEFREKNNFSRNDFFQLLIGLYRRGTIQNDDKVNTTIDSKSSKPLTLSEITAQALIFFAASFETSSSTMAFCLYELAKNGEIQRKVQEEISAAGEITYESVENMKYLESCIDGNF